MTAYAPNAIALPAAEHGLVEFEPALVDQVDYPAVLHGHAVLPVVTAELVDDEPFVDQPYVTVQLSSQVGQGWVRYTIAFQGKCTETQQGVANMLACDAVRLLDGPWIEPEQTLQELRQIMKGSDGVTNSFTVMHQPAPIDPTDSTVSDSDPVTVTMGEVIELSLAICATLARLSPVMNWEILPPV